MVEIGTQSCISYNWLEQVHNTRIFKNIVKKQANRQETCTFVQRIQKYVSWAKVNLAIIQEHQREQANKKRRESDFDIEDWVYVSKDNLQTLEQPSQGFDFPNTDSFKIITKKGHSFELTLPAYMRVHPVFHADRLHKAEIDLLPGQRTIPPPPDLIYDQTKYEVKEILASRTYYKKFQYKVQ